MVEIYPLLIERVGEQEGIIASGRTRPSSCQLTTSEALFGRRRSRLTSEAAAGKSRSEVLFWVAVVGVPLALLIGGGAGVYLGLTSAVEGEWGE